MMRQGFTTITITAHNHNTTHRHHLLCSKREELPGGEERLHVVRVVGPSEDREGEEAGAEPGVQHVLVLRQMQIGRRHVEGSCSFRAGLRLAVAHEPAVVVGGSILIHTGSSLAWQTNEVRRNTL